MYIKDGVQYFTIQDLCDISGILYPTMNNYFVRYKHDFEPTYFPGLRKKVRAWTAPQIHSLCAEALQHCHSQGHVRLHLQKIIQHFELATPELPLKGGLLEEFPFLDELKEDEKDEVIDLQHKLIQELQRGHDILKKALLEQKSNRKWWQLWK
jgi:hypothetical protein